jgi:hypothetical protein
MKIIYIILGIVALYGMFTITTENTANYNPRGVVFDDALKEQLKNDIRNRP